MTSKIERYSFKENMKKIGKKYAIPAVAVAGAIAGAYYNRNHLGFPRDNPANFGDFEHISGNGVYMDRAKRTLKKYAKPIAGVATVAGLLALDHYFPSIPVPKGRGLREDIKRIGKKMAIPAVVLTASALGAIYGIDAVSDSIEATTRNLVVDSFKN